jgi:hypothetical protein
MALLVIVGCLTLLQTWIAARRIHYS